MVETKESVALIVPKLGKAHLSSKVRGKESLSQFLNRKCMRISAGEPDLYRTNNLEYFDFLKESRMLNEAHVLSLISSYRKDGYLFTIIYVNEKLEVIDGQHRFEAAKRLGLPVYFMVMPGWGIREVIILNVNSSNWTLNDFLACYAKAGNENYIRFKEFSDSHPFEVTTSQVLMLGGGAAGGTLDTFRLGKMVVTEQQVEDARKKAAKIADMQLFHPLGWTSRNFVEAMLKLFTLKGYEHLSMLDRLTAHPDVLLAKARSLRTDEYLQLFIDKYNFRRSSGQIFVSK